LNAVICHEGTLNYGEKKIGNLKKEQKNKIAFRVNKN